MSEAASAAERLIQHRRSTRPEPRAERWLVGPTFDSAFVLGGAALVSLSLYASAQSAAALALAGALFAMLTDMPHVLQTSVRIGLDPRERTLHGRRYLTSLLIIAALTLGLFVTGNRPIVAMIWIVWQFFHVVKQHYGIMRIYGAKARYRGPWRLTTLTLFLGCGAPVLYRVGRGMRFGEYVVLGQRLPFSGLGLPDVPVPLALVAAVYAAFAGAAGLFVREQWRLRSASEPVLPAIAHGTLALALVSYNLSYLFVSDLYALIMIATAVHSFQYHAICWRRNHERFSLAEARRERPIFLAVLSRRKNLWAYAGLMVVLGATVANTELLWLGFIPFVFVLHHFYMDGYIWRSSLNPTLAADLGLSRPPVVSKVVAK